MQVLARGPWEPGQVRVRWRADSHRPAPEVGAAADAALAALAARGSPSHDSIAARVAAVRAAEAELALELQPVRWSLRLVEGAAEGSLFVHCLVRDAGGRWLAGRRAPWLAVLPGAWHLGAAGSVAANDDPVAILRQEVGEEWGVAANGLLVAGLLAEPSGRTVLVGLATVPSGTEPRPNDEHDAWAWWPADPAAWPSAAAPELRAVAVFAAGVVKGREQTR
jgi:8-oxo-dGTP diphosphatase